jgi:hypothetical protein
MTRFEGKVLTEAEVGDLLRAQAGREQLWQELTAMLDSKIWDLPNAVSINPDHDWIAKELERRGIKGRREKGTDCPVVNLVKPVLHAGMICDVTGDHLHVYRDVPEERKRENYPACLTPLVTIDLPDYFTEFVYQFDAGSYPALIDLT